jgi:hypothetical protein
MYILSGVGKRQAAKVWPPLGFSGKLKSFIIIIIIIIIIITDVSQWTCYFLAF